LGDLGSFFRRTGNFSCRVQRDINRIATESAGAGRHRRKNSGPASGGPAIRFDSHYSYGRSPCAPQKRRPGRNRAPVAAPELPGAISHETNSRPGRAPQVWRSKPRQRAESLAISNIRHSVQVPAESLYEAAVLAMRAFREHDCASGPNIAQARFRLICTVLVEFQP
jgi:hypothetical protein